jgi:hypothetical protein
VLAALGGARTHLHNFTLFLVILLGLAVSTVVVFMATATEDSPE